MGAIDQGVGPALVSFAEDTRSYRRRMIDPFSQPVLRDGVKIRCRRGMVSNFGIMKLTRLDSKIPVLRLCVIPFSRRTAEIV